MGKRNGLWFGLWQDVYLNGIVASPVIPRVARYLALRLYGFQVGKCAVSSGIEWFGSGPVMIGERTFINRGCVINHSGAVTIGRDVAIGPGCLIVAASHEHGPGSQRAAAGYSAPVVVGDGAWLGARVTVLGGVTIGSGVVVAAGAVVTEDLAPDAVYGGVPAKLIKICPQIA